MSDFLHERKYLNEGIVALLDCDTQCNFIALDDYNFNRYKNGLDWKGYGGFFEYFPARIEIPQTGYWNMVIDLGGGRAYIKYNLSYFAG